MQTFKRITPALIRAAAEYTTIPVSTLLSKVRTRQICQVRFAIMWVARDTLGLSLCRIRDELKMGNHTTIHSGLLRAKELLETSEHFRGLVAHLVLASKGEAA